jgi:hypothetical protein
LTRINPSVVNPEKRCQPKNRDILRADARETRLVMRLFWEPFSRL